MDSFTVSSGKTASPPSIPPEEIDGLQMEIAAIGAEFQRRGWSLATSSNYSVRLRHSPLDVMITASGRDKSRLAAHDFVRVSNGGKSVALNQPASSAETMLHTAIYEDATVGAVLHTHSVWSTVLSDLFSDQGFVEFRGYEMQKGLNGIRSHEETLSMAILENSQDIPELAAIIQARRQAGDRHLQYGFLLRRHGLYTWGADLQEARRHVEALEFLFECLARRQALSF